MKILTDGLFIRSLLCSFFFKLFPEIIEDGRLYIAEPPLYRVDDKKDPFAINKEDYNRRYIKNVIKNYKLGIKKKKEVEWMNRDDLYDMLVNTSSYIEEIHLLSKHYLVNDRLLEIVLEELAKTDFSKANLLEVLKTIDIQHLMNYIGEEFPELIYDDKDHLIRGNIDGVYQSLEFSERLLRKSLPLVDMIRKYCPKNNTFILRDVHGANETETSLLGVLKILERFKPEIIRRFKGLGENTDEDIKVTVMDPNTRSLIKLKIEDMKNDMRIFQVLRGNSPEDARARKALVANTVIDKELLDT
nr:MAG TPA: DNA TOPOISOMERASE IV, B SUBUNIT [Caudoviricetes sp.]